MGLFHYYDITHAEVFVFDDFLIKQMREGFTISYQETEEFIAILNHHFKNKNMVYISNRVTNYSIDPAIYKEAEKISNLLAIAVIPGNKKMRDTAEYEKQFYKKPFSIFENLTEAIKWVRVIIDKENQKA
ncbi:hypothetical protein [uncultured Lacinutrix sp.]|uniref:hypothetical protein n=1 Tax=uncultured Lacinutrix sp. TaxID=574032 RepID=UPI00262D8209|nr:hypothetical protein [uncultured Lacinutrix sp.]